MTMHHGSYRRLLLFLVLFISSQQISGQISYEYCPSFTCGRVEVRYPFWNSSKKDIKYCGYERLNVACSEDNKTLTFATLTDNYTVKDIDYDKKTISLVHTDVKDEECPKVQHGFNISNIPVLSTDPEVVVNLTFFFGCNLSIGDPPIPTGFPADQATCLDNGDEKAFVFAGEVNPRWKDWLSQSCSGGEVVSPVMKKGVTQTNVSELFPNYLKEGFQLKWENSDKADCRKCEGSGGRCGYSDKAGAGLESICFCKEAAPHRGNCNSSGSGTNIITILVVIVSVSIALICASLLCCFFKSKSKKRKGTTKEVEEELKQERANLSFFEFELLVPPPATSATVTGLDGAALASSTRLDLPLPCHTGSSFISPYPTMGSEATTLLFLLLLFPHLTLPCPVEWLSCEQGAEMNQDGGEKICGHDNFKCVNSTLYIKFHGKGNWYTAVEIRYPEKTLTVRDESLVKRLPSKDNCSFLYNFTSPIQNFDPSVFTSADSTASFFDCKANKYNFTADAFETEYNSSYCADYNLYYSYEGGMANTSPPDDDDCLLDTNATTPAVEWKLSFEDDASGGVRFILLSAGFSLRRKISPTCFSCKMSKGHCGSAKNNSSETSPYCNCNLKCPARVSGTKKTKIITIAVVIVSVSVALICAPLLCCFFKSKSKKRKGATKKVEEELKQERANLSFFEFELLVAATGNFSDGNRIGRGGFGIVYKGKLANGLEIAVKRLSNISRQGLQEFKNEVKVMAKLQHKNLVKLLGYCLRREEKILIYEFLPNGSLDSFFSDNERRTLLDWKKRFNIIKGIAKGLLYLHEDSRLRIIHRDLKAGNILLDKDMNPKISDFGMARIFGGNQNEAETVRVVGTYGYMSPEYAMKGHFSMKSDVYSYGILVLEILSGKRNTSFHSSSFQTLLSYAWQLWEDNLQVELMDPSMVGVYEMDNVLRCLHVALLCVQDCANDRPTMSWVVHMLENPFVPLDRQPKQPTFTAVVDDIAQNPGVKIPQSVFSINELTITNVDGR